MASAQVVETSVNTNNSPSQDYTTNPDDHSNHNSLGFVTEQDLEHRKHKYNINNNNNNDNDINKKQRRNLESGAFRPRVILMLM